MSIPALPIKVQAAHFIEEGGSNAYTLPFRHYYQASGPVVPSLEHRAYCQVRNWLITYKAYKILGCDRVRQV